MSDDEILGTLGTTVWTAEALRADITGMVASMGREAYIYPLCAVDQNDPNTAACSYGGDANGTGDGHRCIVGEWLSRVGVDMAAVTYWERRALSADVAATGSGVRALYGAQPTPLPRLTREALLYLARVQGLQDLAHPWGGAVRNAWRR